MFLYNIKVAWRILLKYKLQTVISVISLAVGITCFSLSSLWMKYEECYDDSWPDNDNIFMLKSKDNHGSLESDFNPYLSFPTGTHLVNKISEIRELTRCQQNAATLHVAPDDTCMKYNVEGLMVDSSFMSFMGIKVLEGEKASLCDEHTMAITQSLAKKIFPDGKALGRLCILILTSLVNMMRALSQ